MKVGTVTDLWPGRAFDHVDHQEVLAVTLRVVVHPVVAHTVRFVRVLVGADLVAPDDRDGEVLQPAVFILPVAVVVADVKAFSLEGVRAASTEVDSIEAVRIDDVAHEGVLLAVARNGAVRAGDPAQPHGIPDPDAVRRERHDRQS